VEESGATGSGSSLGTVANVVAEVQKNLEQIDGQRPAAPAALPG
jgi:hypothetical protein